MQTFICCFYQPKFTLKKNKSSIRKIFPRQKLPLIYSHDSSTTTTQAIYSFKKYGGRFPSILSGYSKKLPEWKLYGHYKLQWNNPIELSSRFSTYLWWIWMLRVGFWTDSWSRRTIGDTLYRKQNHYYKWCIQIFHLVKVLLFAHLICKS